MRYLRAAIFWFNFITFTFLLFIFLIFVVLFYKVFARDRRTEGAHWVATLWGRLLMALAPGWTSKVTGTELLPRLRKDPPVVFVANHQSGADIWALYLTGAQFRWLSKKEVFQIPLIGSAMKWAGYVPINRGDRGSHSLALKQSAEWLKKGISMVFFPEGTRSEDGRIKDFKPGAFKLALECGVAIQPIIIRGTRDMMQKKSLMPMPARLEVEILPPVSAKPNESSEEFTIRVHNIFKDKLPLAMKKIEYSQPEMQSTDFQFEN